MKKTLSEMLLRRSELKTVTQLLQLVEGQKQLFDPKVTRRMISDQPGNQIEQVDLQLPKCEKAQVERERDYYSHMWRLCDSAVQQCNHTVKVSVPKSVMKDFVTSAEIEPGEVSETLASLLTRRKMLADKVKETIGRIDWAAFIEARTARRSPAAGLDDMLKVDKVPASDLLAKQLHYVRQLRLCEEAIHRANNDTQVEVDDRVFIDFKQS